MIMHSIIKIYNNNTNNNINMIRCDMIIIGYWVYNNNYNNNSNMQICDIIIILIVVVIWEYAL